MVGCVFGYSTNFVSNLRGPKLRIMPFIVSGVYTNLPKLDKTISHPLNGSGGAGTVRNVVFPLSIKWSISD